MRVRRPIAVALFLALPSTPAAASELSSEVGLVSDYRFRGVSLSHGHPAVQADVSLEDDSGLYADLWASTLGESDPTHSEIDLTIGYSAELNQHLSVDVSVMYYAYPSEPSDGYFESTAQATATRGPFAASLGISVAPGQHGTDHHGNFYGYGSIDYVLPRTPVTLKAGLGYERGTFDEVEHGAKLDWTLGGEVKLKPARLGLAYVGSNADGGNRHALVASAFVEF